MKRSTYRLLVQSEEKSRDILETALYALVALAGLLTIWQFAEEPNALSLHQVRTGVEQSAGQRIAG